MTPIYAINQLILNNRIGTILFSFLLILFLSPFQALSQCPNTDSNTEIAAGDCSGNEDSGPCTPNCNANDFSILDLYLGKADGSCLESSDCDGILPGQTIDVFVCHSE